MRYINSRYNYFTYLLTYLLISGELTLQKCLTTISGPVSVGALSMVVSSSSSSSLEGPRESPADEHATELGTR